MAIVFLRSRKCLLHGQSGIKEPARVWVYIRWTLRDKKQEHCTIVPPRMIQQNSRARVNYANLTREGERHLTTARAV